MNIDSSFVRLPFFYESERIAPEISAIGSAPWLVHPRGWSGHQVLPLVSVGGQSDLTQLYGKFSPTYSLTRLPSIIALMNSFGVVVGRSMLMSVAAETDAPKIIDIGYYWANRVRIVIPLAGCSSGIFWHCGDESINIPNGEAWLINGWKGMFYRNRSEERLLVLVIETVGSPSFWSLVLSGDRSGKSGGKTPLIRRKVEVCGGSPKPLLTERREPRNFVSPWLVEGVVSRLLRLIGPTLVEGHDRYLRMIEGVLRDFAQHWHSVFGVYGQDRAGTREYQGALDHLIARSARVASTLTLPNGLGIATLLHRALVVDAIRSETAAMGTFLTPELTRRISAAKESHDGNGPGGTGFLNGSRQNVNADACVPENAVSNLVEAYSGGATVGTGKRKPSSKDRDTASSPVSRIVDSRKANNLPDAEFASAGSPIRDHGLSSILNELSISLLVSTYQSNKVLSVTGSDGELYLQSYPILRPMGMCLNGNRLAIGALKSIEVYMGSHGGVVENGGGRSPAGQFLLRNSHITGSIDIHELAWADDGLWFVNTRFSCLCRLDPEFSFVPSWMPDFVSQCLPEDRCHLNGLEVVDGKPRYVTALGTTDSPGGWRENRSYGGVLIDVQSNETICRGLSMPHSPRWYQDHLWLLDSGSGSLSIVDERGGVLEAVVSMRGFTRGLVFFDRYAFVGLSQVRESAVFSGIPLTDRIQNLVCGISVVDIYSGEIVGSAVFDNSIQEVFSIALVPDSSSAKIFGSAGSETAEQFASPQR
mgnify:CR=1 FL=1